MTRIKITELPSRARMYGNRSSYILLVGMQNDTSTLEEYLEVFNKVNHIYTNHL